MLLTLFFALAVLIVAWTALSLLSAGLLAYLLRNRRSPNYWIWHQAIVAAWPPCQHLALGRAPLAFLRVLKSRLRAHRLAEAIEDRIDAWHEGAGSAHHLHVQLGWSRAEYDHWLQTAEFPLRDLPPLR